MYWSDTSDTSVKAQVFDATGIASSTELEALYARFSALADRKKGILDEEIRELAGASRKPAA